ncbi:MAG: GIY-YIG nuclease family protein [Rickettsia endosymbiont of Sergentomyia squamirostris]|uniref:GIY-YIG nuclease family protein n=1 Tax=Candidatus Tisiphia endosymbiont of Sergentomyia squamirostris TaxID=3113639 RepID=A0AAT9G883_9RICK
MSYYVYIITNKPGGVLYIGVTNDLNKRIFQHKEKIIDGFSKRYNLTKLVYVEEFSSPIEAISREKQLKNWHRTWKENLIAIQNPNWDDLSKLI